MNESLNEEQWTLLREGINLALPLVQTIVTALTEHEETFDLTTKQVQEAIPTIVALWTGPGKAADINGTAVAHKIAKRLKEDEEEAPRLQEHLGKRVSGAKYVKSRNIRALNAFLNEHPTFVKELKSRGAADGRAPETIVGLRSGLVPGA